MHIQRRLLATALPIIIGIAGCATPYRPPEGPIPAGWDGPHGREVVPGSLQLHPGTLHVGGTILESEFKFVRTGTIAETVQTRNPYGHPLILPKGAKAYATNYSLTMRGVKIQKIDPIEWCVILPDGIDGLKDGSQTVCLFYENEKQARYLEDFRKGGYRFNVQLYGNAGMPGPLPKIEEGPVDFGVTLRSQLQIAEIDKSGIRLQSVFTDGTDSDPYENFKLKWNASGQISMGSGPNRFTLTPSPDFKSVDMEAK